MPNQMSNVKFLEQEGRRNNLLISGIPDSVQDSDLEINPLRY